MAELMKTLLSILLMASLTYGQGKSAPPQGPPPKNLAQKADGHFTANQDPANPEKFEVYTVKSGDTLSVIAGTVLKNPRLWPQLWEQNEHIVNPHWIYPNDKILIRPITQITEAAPPPPPAPAPPAPVVAPPPPPTPPPVVVPLPPEAVAPPKAEPMFDLGVPKPVPEVKGSDMYCSGFIRQARVASNMKVSAKYNSNGSALATASEYIYVSRGAEDGVRAGDLFQVVRPTRRIEGYKGESKAERDLGMHYLDVAQIQIVTTQPDFSLARVVNSCEAVEIGDLMVPFQKMEPPVPVRPRPFSPLMTVSGGLEGSIVITLSALNNFGSVFHASGVIPGVRTASLNSIQRGIAGQGAIVYVDLGQNAGVKPGDVFIVYRPVDIDPQLYKLPVESRKMTGQKTAIGELIILKVNESASTALVTYSPVGISAGDSISRR